MQTTLAVDSATGIVSAALLLVSILLIVCLVLLLRVKQSVAEIKTGVDHFFEGDVARGIPVDGPLGLNELSASLGQVAREINGKLGTAVSQRKELEGVLTSMVEGVLAVDREERFLRLNNAAAGLLDIDPARAVGRSIQEVVRNTALQEFVARTLASASPVQGEIVLRSDGVRVDASGGDYNANDRSLQAQGVKLRDATGREIGALIVLHDITRMRRLENMRRDFVANVSHEIKTPIAAIKAAVETVLQPGEQDPEDTRRFLEMIARQAERLHALVEDVLTLARIEQDAEKAKIDLKPNSVYDVLVAATEACQLQAAGKGMTLELACDEELTASLHAGLLEHAVINLINNAVKYSPENTKIVVSAYIAVHGQGGDSPKAGGHAEEGLPILTKRSVVISVLDQGMGIEPEYLPRVFERFFRPDKSRNRSQGGTGLGLAIVKHTVQAHGGRVSVDSTVGKGSNFRIHLPLA